MADGHQQGDGRVVAVFDADRLLHLGLVPAVIGEVASPISVAASIT
jgi:hypothetical protein